MCTLLVTQTVVCLVLECELTRFSMCTLLVTQMWPVLFQVVSWPAFNVHYSGDTDVACLVSVCELAWFLVCTPLVTQTVACLDSVCELACFFSAFFW